MLIGRISAQELLPSIFSSGGKYATSQSYKLSYTLGQAISTTHINSTNNIVGIGYQQYMDSTDIAPPPLNKYNIGEIPNQIVYFKTNLSFEVYSKELGVTAALSIKPNGVQKGDVIFKPETGFFEYIPDSLDFKPFTIDFIAVKGLDTIKQSVLFNCIAYLPHEQIVFGIDNNSFIPDSLDKDYIILNSIDNPGQEMFNNSMRKTRNISIIGKTIVFENGHPSGFYNNYNKNTDIKTFTIYAQTLIIKSSLDLPQTNMTIYAENLEFSNNTAYISIKPETNQQNATTNNNGNPGMGAGRMNLYIKNFKAPSGIRFFLNGGDGQSTAAGSGNPGNGANGGIFTSNLNFDNFVDVTGGNPGGGGTNIATRGLNGSIVREWNSEYKWLHPFWLKMLVKFSKDSYLEGNLSFTVSATEKYIREVDKFSETNEWGSADIFIKTELQQISYEINSIIQRVNSNLDYFGNPAGWTPMLSFEANKTIFENEIERSIKTMYLAYWIKNAISTLEQKVASLSNARNELSLQLENNIGSFNVLTELIPAIEDEISEITIQTDSLQQELISIENLLAARAEQIVKDRNKVPSWKKYTAIAGQIMQVIPAYQPALGTVGTALIEISKYDSNKSFKENLEYYQSRNLSELFKKENFQASIEEVDIFLKTIDPKQVKDFGSAKDYASNLASIAKKGQEKYKEILGIIKKEQQVPKDEIDAVLSNLKASDPAFNELADKIAVLLAQKESLINKILSVNDNIQKLNSEIGVSLLGMDGLNKNISAAQNVLDDRVKVYLDDMENRAKERLLKYHYFMKKAYEFRMVTPYTQTLNLQNIFDRFKVIAESTNSSSLLSESQFLSLKSLYDDQIARIAEQIFTEYNQNVPEFTAPLRFSLTKQQLKSLDDGNPVVINLVEMGLFNPNEENLRITDINIFSIDVKSSGQINSTSFFNIDMVHSGISKLRKNGKAYLFRNYNNRTERPIGWYFKFDRFSNNIDKIPFSFASQSLLTTMMSIKGIPASGNNILLYSRPAAWADIVITKSVHPNSTSIMTIDSLVLELQYDFQRMPNNFVAYNISSTNNLKPLIEINRKDNNNRQNGYGSVSRVYNRSSSQNLIISVPKVMESFVFDRWTDPNGNDLGPLPLKDTTLSLSLSFGTSVKANYTLVNPILEVSTNLIEVNNTGGERSFEIRNIGNGVLDWRIQNHSNWITVIGPTSGVNNKSIMINLQPYTGTSNRIDTLFVISENSMNYIQKIVVIQNFGNSTALLLDIDDNVCSGINAEIEVPVRVKNYNKIAGLQFKIASSNNNTAEITGVTNINSNSGLGSIDFAVVDKKLVLTYADAEKTLSDNAILFSVKVRLKGAVNSTANLNFEGDLKALDTNGAPVTVTGVQGSVCVSQTAMSVSGRITNTKDKGIVNANVIVTTGSNQVTTKKSDNTGQFTITDLMSGTNYKVKPNFTEPLANGVDISDLFLLRRHMQGLSLFSSPYTYLAADMNVDKQIDISDLFLMRRIMQGLTTELPNNQPAWRFVPKSYSFPASGNPLSGTIPDVLEYTPLTANQTNQHFTGVKYGDLDHSLISSNNPLTGNRSVADVELNIGSVTAASGSTVTLDMKCKNFIKGEVLQFSIQWPTDKLQLVNVPSGADIVIPGTTTFDQTQLAQGKLGLFWETDNNNGGGTTLSDNSIVYRLKFKLIGANNTTAMIENSATPKPAKFLDVNFTEIPIRIGTGTVTIATTSASVDENVDKLIRIYPNPTTGIISIESDNNEIKNLEIRSLDGKLIHKVTELKDNTIDLSNLAPGSYILKGVSNNYPFSKKVVILR